MAGTREGSLKASLTIKERYGEDYYAKIGRRGGQNSTTGGFAARPELASEAGRKGGKISRRGPARKSMVRKVNDGESLMKGIDG